MRIVGLLAFLLIGSTLKAQTFVPASFIDYGYRGHLANSLRLNDSTAGKKWFFTKYSSISTSFIFSKGGSATIVSAPIGLQLNRRINNNLFAFAGISVAPAYINFNQSFLRPGFDKTNQANSFLKGSGVGMYSRAELGLQYINDERTFSISGSIGIERNSYPMPFYNQMNDNRSTRELPAIRQ